MRVGALGLLPETASLVIEDLRPSLMGPLVEVFDGRLIPRSMNAPALAVDEAIRALEVS